MNETQFLIKALEDWCNRFKGIHVRYAYDAQTEYHIIEIDPENIRRGNDLYKQDELSLWMNFMEQFPESNLLITEPSKANNMSNYLFENSQVILPESLVSSTDDWKMLFKFSFHYQNNYKYTLAA